MKQTEHMGMNRTGMQMSPLESKAMQSAPSSISPNPPGDDSALADMRFAYILDADPLGSVPAPATLKGALHTGVAMLKGERPQVLLDKLGERLAFERTGTRLYDALITKCEAARGDEGNNTSMAIDDLWEIREDEARHFMLLSETIESLGGDPTAQTPSADLVGVESMGLVQVLTDPRTTIAQSLHAILTAELADQAGWETLIALAEDHDQSEMIDEFSVALDEERAHLQQVQTWYDEAIGVTAFSDDDEVDDLPP